MLDVKCMISPLCSYFPHTTHSNLLVDLNDIAKINDAKKKKRLFIFEHAVVNMAGMPFFFFFFFFFRLPLFSLLSLFFSFDVLFCHSYPPQVSFRQPVKMARMIVPAGKAAPSASIGQALGPMGINMMDFCKQFNAKTTPYIEGTPIPVRVWSYEDRSFTFVTRPPQTVWLLKRCAGIEKGAKQPGREIVGIINVKQIYEIAKLKKELDEGLEDIPLRSVCKTIIATARNIGLRVVNS